MSGTGHGTRAFPAVHLIKDEGVQSYTEPYPRLSRDGTNRGPFIPGRSVVHITTLQGEWAYATVDGEGVGWVLGSALVPPLGGVAGSGPAVPPPPSAFGSGAAPASNGIAVAALVLGILAAVFSLTFFLLILAVPLAILAIVFGRIGMTRARDRRSGSGQAIAGFTLGIIGLVISAYLIWTVGSFFRTVSQAIDRSAKATVVADPAINRMTLDQCSTTISRAVASGTVVNPTKTMHNYTVTVTFIGPGGSAESVGSAYDVEAGGTGTWYVQGPAVTELSGCAFGPTSAATPPSTRPADPPR